MENICDVCGCYSKHIVDYFCLLCPSCKAKSEGWDINQLMEVGIQAQERELEARRRLKQSTPIVQSDLNQWRKIK